jgi:hypothetical protein
MTVRIGPSALVRTALGVDHRPAPRPWARPSRHYHCRCTWPPQRSPTHACTQACTIPATPSPGHSSAPSPPPLSTGRSAGTRQSSPRGPVSSRAGMVRFASGVGDPANRPDRARRQESTLDFSRGVPRTLETRRTRAGRSSILDAATREMLRPPGLGECFPTATSRPQDGHHRGCSTGLQ